MSGATCQRLKLSVGRGLGFGVRILSPMALQPCVRHAFRRREDVKLYGTTRMAWRHLDALSERVY